MTLVEPQVGFWWRSFGSEDQEGKFASIVGEDSFGNSSIDGTIWCRIFVSYILQVCKGELVLTYPGMEPIRVTLPIKVSGHLVTWL